MFAERLKEASKAKRYSQAEVSRMLGVTQQAVGKWETGRSTPDPQTVARLAEILDTPTDVLLGLRKESGAASAVGCTAGAFCCGSHAQRSRRHPAGHPGSGAAQGRTCPHQPPRRTTARCARRARSLNMPTPICCEPYNCGKPRAALAARGLPYPKAYFTMGKKQKDVT